jgi:hypothetical protein
MHAAALHHDICRWLCGSALDVDKISYFLISLEHLDIKQGDKFCPKRERESQAI